MGHIPSPEEFQEILLARRAKWEEQRVAKLQRTVEIATERLTTWLINVRDPANFDSRHVMTCHLGMDHTYDLDLHFWTDHVAPVFEAAGWRLVVDERSDSDGSYVLIGLEPL